MAVSRTGDTPIRATPYTTSLDATCSPSPGEGTTEVSGSAGAVSKGFGPWIPTGQNVSDSGSRSFRIPPTLLPPTPAYGRPSGRPNTESARQSHDHGWGAWDSNPQPKD